MEVGPSSGPGGAGLSVRAQRNFGSGSLDLRRQCTNRGQTPFPCGRGRSLRTAAVVLTVFAAMSCLSVYSSASPSATAEEANSSDEEYCSNRPPGTGSGRALNAFPVADAGDAIVIGVFVRRDVG